MMIYFKLGNGIEDINDFLGEEDDGDFDDEEEVLTPLFERQNTVPLVAKPVEQNTNDLVIKKSEKLKEFDESNDVSMYEPTFGKDIKGEYPDLNDVEEFSILTSRELSFVWAFANKTSPFLSIKDKKEKIQKCLLLAFRGDLDKEILQRYTDEDFPDTVVNAISVMKRYIPSIRMRAKLLAEKQFQQIELMSNIDNEYAKIMNTDEKKKYADYVNTSTTVIPKLIEVMENSYGIKTKKLKTTETKGMTLMDRVIEDE